MTYQSPHQGSDLAAGDDTGSRPDHAAPPRVSRWQKAVGTIGLVAVLWAGNNLYDAIDRGGGGRGPGRDTPGENGGQGPETDGGGVHTPGPPVGGH